MNKNLIQNKKFERTTQEQLHFYMKFCKEHPEFKPGTQKEVLKVLWNELARNLNALRGPSRTAVKWRENMSHWRKQKRYRARKAKSELEVARTGSYHEGVNKCEVKTIQDYDTSDVDMLGWDDAFETENELNDHDDPLTSRVPYIDEVVVSTVTPIDAANNLVISDDEEAEDECDFESLCSTNTESDTPFRSKESPIKNTKTNDESEKIIELILESIQTREKREERALEQQKHLTDVLIAMTKVIEKLTDKLDRT